MSVSQEVTIAFDQMAAASAVIDDDSISFTCGMWHIFLREILLDRDVFQSINAEILIGNIVIRPWYDQDGNFPLAMREAFKWRIDYPEDQDRMNANFDFWFDEVFHNNKLSFRYSNDYGIGVHFRMAGDLYVVNDYLYCFIEFISRETYLLLHEEHWHWSLLTYKDENYKEWYAIVYGTGSLVNHHNQAGVIFEVVEDPEGARDKAFKLSYLSSEKVIDHGNCLSIQTVLSLQVDRVVIEETEADDAVFGRLDLIQSSLNVWGPALA